MTRIYRRVQVGFGEEDIKLYEDLHLPVPMDAFVKSAFYDKVNNLTKKVKEK